MGTAGRRSALTAALVLGWLAASVSVVGDELLDFVFIVDAARGTRPLSIGVIGFLIGAPALLGGWIGSWIDARRADAHVILVGACTMSACVATALWSLWSSSVVAPAVYAATFLLGLLGVVTTTMWLSSIPELAASGDQDTVKRVMGWTSMTFSLGAAAGPLAAATLAPLVGTRQLIAVDAATFVAAAVLFVPAGSALRRARRDAAATDVSPDGRRTKWREGLRLIFSRPLIRGPVLALSVMNFVMFGTAFAVPLMVVQRGFSDRVVAWVAALFVVGGLVGQGVATRFRQDRMFALYLVGEPALRAAGLLVVALSGSAAGILVGVTMFTVPQGMGRVARLSYMATSFEPGERAKVFGTYQMLVRGLMPLAPLVMEGVVDRFGTTTFLVASAVGLVGLSVAIAADQWARRAPVPVAGVEA